MVLGIYGAGGLGKKICDLAEKSLGDLSEIIMIDDITSEKIIRGKQVMKYDEFKQVYSSDFVSIVIAQGEPIYRQMLYDKVKKDGYSCATLVHPKAVVAPDCVIGEGVIVFDGCHVGAESIIENNVCLMANVAVGHNVRIEKHSQIGSCTAIGGFTEIKSMVYIGLSSSVRDRIRIGTASIISQGSCVLKNVPEKVVVMGNPARVILKNKDGKVWH